jgi:hypothetical protein
MAVADVFKQFLAMVLVTVYKQVIYGFRAG